jgi:hypothetical protein
MMHTIEMQSKFTGDPIEIEENQRYAHSLGYSTEMPTGEGTLIIVAGGPSLEECIEEIRDLSQAGEKILACNGAYQYLQEAGIAPWAMMILDTDENNSDFVKIRNGHTIHLIASRCHKSVFDMFPPWGGQRLDVRVWDISANVDEINANGRPVVGDKSVTANGGKRVASGSTVAIQALISGFNMGFRNFEFFGMDSCVMNDRHHTYSQPWNDECEVWPDPIYVGDRGFICESWMILQAQDFQKILRVMWPYIGLKVHGDGLIAAILEEGERVYQKQKKRPSEPKKDIEGGHVPTARARHLLAECRPAGAGGVRTPFPRPILASVNLIDGKG